MKKILTTQNLYKLIFFGLFGLVTVFDIHTFSYEFRNILIFTIIGIGAIPLYVGFKRGELNLSYFNRHKYMIIMYLLIVPIILYNYILTNDLTYAYSVLKGRLPAFLSLELYAYSLLFVLVMYPFFKKYFRFKFIECLSYYHILLGLYSIIHYYYFAEFKALIYSFGNSNYAGDPYLILYFFIMIPMLTSKLNYKHLIISTLLLVLAFFPNSRALILSACATMMFITLYLAFRRKITVKGVIILGVQFILVTGINLLFVRPGVGDINTFNSFVGGEITADTLSAGRITLWTNILQTSVRDIPTFLFGTGPSTFRWLGGSNHNAHNMYIEIFGSMGIVGLIIFTIIFFKFLIAAFKIAQRNIQLTYLLTALIYIFTKWMFNSYMATTSVYVLMVFTIILVQFDKLEEEKHETN